MYCAQCGAWNPDDAEYCAKCGEKLIGAGAPSSTRGIAPCVIMGLLVVLVTASLLAVGVLVFRERFQGAWLALTGGSAPELATPTVQVAPATVTRTLTPVLTSSPVPSETPVPTVTPTAAPTVEPTPEVRSFRLEYRQCVPHGSSLGSVKGQVFDREGKVIAGAKVRIRIDDYDWESDANPATTNGEGWYEWTLEVGQMIKFMELFVDGEKVVFSPAEFEVESRAGCFQRVDFVEE